MTKEGKKRTIIKGMTRNHLSALARIDATSEENFWSRSVFSRFVKRQGCAILVAINGGRPVAFVAYEKTGFVVQIWNLVILPEFRRQGIGTRLIKKIKKLVPSKFDSIIFNVRESNLTCQLFLSKNNFWCESIARGYFIDQTNTGSKYEDAYCFCYDPSKQRSENEGWEQLNRNLGKSTETCR